MVNTSFGKEYDYPITATTNEEYTYDGNAGLSLGFIDRLVLAINEKNFKLTFSFFQFLFNYIFNTFSSQLLLL